MLSPTHRRAARLAITLPAAMAAWALIGGLPLAAALAPAGSTAAPTGRSSAVHASATTPAAATMPAAATPAAATGHLVSQSIDLAAPTATVRTSGRLSAAGSVATVQVPTMTQSVTLTWAGSADGSARIRSRTAGVWSAWASDASDPDEGPDRGGNGRSGIGPFWLGHDGADAVQVAVVHGPLPGLSLDAMRWVPPKVDRAARVTGNANATATAGGSGGSGGSVGSPRASVAGGPVRPTIHLPSEWGSGGWQSTRSGCSGGPPVMSSLGFAVIHHTVNANDYSPADVPGLMAAIYRYHTVSRGWCDTAYNFIIDRFGRIWQGRSGDPAQPVMGGHAMGFNTSSVGVAFLGQYEPSASPAVALPTQAALDSARDLIAWKFGIHGVDPTVTIAVTSQGSTRYRAGVAVNLPTIIGHRDVALTACPGLNLYGQLAAMRLGVAAALRAGQVAWSPFPSAPALVTQQFRDVLHRDVDAADVSPWATRLENRSWSIGQFVTTLLGSTEADRKVDSVVRLYFAFFLRAPDHSGITYWLGQRARGASLSRIASSFASSAEFANRYGRLSDVDYVKRIYANVLGRSPDAAGLRYWADRLTAGASRGQVMANFSESGEYAKKSAGKVFVATTFEALLQRAVDPTNLTYYLGRLAAGTNQSTLVGTVFASAEYQRRF